MLHVSAQHVDAQRPREGGGVGEVGPGHDPLGCSNPQHISTFRGLSVCSDFLSKTILPPLLLELSRVCTIL